MPNLLKKEKPSQKLLEESYKKLHTQFLRIIELEVIQVIILVFYFI